MFRLAHISDVHLGPLPKVRKRDLISKRITGYLNWRRNRAKALGNAALARVLDDMADHAPDHVAVTGDLMNLSLKEEMQAGRIWLDALGTPRDVSFVPGNHDAYVIGALGRTVAAFQPFLEGDGGREDETLRGARAFPYVRVRGPLALIGANSARATPAFVAAGHFSESQAQALEAALREAGRRGFCRVVMIHHPPVRGATTQAKRLFGISRFQKAVAAAGAELVLHGHTHLPTLHALRGLQGAVPVVGVTAAGQMPGGHRPNGGWNAFDIEGAAGNWRITLTRRALADDGLALVTRETTIL